MRPDAVKVFIERPRTGMRTKYHRQLDDRQVHDDELPTREKMLPRHQNTKSLSDFLSPLFGLLRKSVGRKWDDVYSEIRAVADHRSVTGHHLLEHVGFAVYSWGEWCCRRFWTGRDVYYVDQDGILCAAQPDRDPEPTQQTDVVPIDERSEYRRIDGVWYEIELAPVHMAGPMGVFPFGKDVVTGEQVVRHFPPVADIGIRHHYSYRPAPFVTGALYKDGRDHKQFTTALYPRGKNVSGPDRTAWAAVSKRQLGKKEIKRAGLGRWRSHPQREHASRGTTRGRPRSRRSTGRGYRPSLR